VNVAVLSTGVANTAAVLTALRRAGATPILVDEPQSITEAERLVVPGVGAFGAAMTRLEDLGLVDVLCERIAAGRPTLGICLGLQILAASSEETPGRAGLGVFPIEVSRFPPDSRLRCPHLGWNEVDGGALVRPGAAWFAHSYRLAVAPEGWTASWTDHGDRFVAALQRGAVLACQFHPELSGSWGRALLRRWLDQPC
jgi:imidazole glycerol phosphate synthase glutamine amidotransferase subunit